MTKVIIFGANGQLGREFQSLFNKNNIKYYAFDLPECDITSLFGLKELILSSKAGLIINCAAYNNVDHAELHPNLAFKVNSAGVYNLSIIANELSIPLIHFSSDYVFDGKKSEPYLENDVPSPINFYGKSKLYGEQLLTSKIENFLIFRLSWIYGDGEQNFIYKFLEWCKNNDKLKIVNDEISVPTHTKIIADITLKAYQQGLTGLYHLVNTGYCSRFEWAKSINEFLTLEKEIIPAIQKDFNLPARRPKFSAMDNQAISKTLNIEIPHWKECLKNYLGVKYY